MKAIALVTFLISFTLLASAELIREPVTTELNVRSLVPPDFLVSIHPYARPGSVWTVSKGACQSQAFVDIAREVSGAIDWSVDPCQDFWHFSCGSWIKNTQLPADKSSLTRSFTMILQKNQDILKEVVENSRINEKLNSFFNSCLNTTNMDSQGHKPINAMLASIDKCKDLSCLFSIAGKLYQTGLSVLFHFGPTVDSKHPENTIAGFDQGGLNLPYPSIYTDDDPSSKKIREGYMSFLTTMFTLIGATDPKQKAESAFQVETMIAGISVNPDDLIDPFATYNPMTYHDFQALAPHVDFRAARVLQQTANYLSNDFRDAYFEFYGKILGGVKEQEPRWRSCLAATDSSFGELLGKYYVEKAFPGSSQDTAIKLLAGIMGSMKVDLNGIQWMDDKTRQRALTKLGLVDHLIGSPTHPDTYKGVNVGWDYFSNIMSSNVYDVKASLARIGGKTDKQLWQMTPATVNAYYDPTLNEMVFPAGILQQPFFNNSFPIEMNIGGIGMVMGHELTHGFDNQGRLYNGQGVLENWWEPETSKKFDDKVQCVIDQYSKFEPIPGVHVNGKLTQGENIADMGGIKLAFHSLVQALGDDRFKNSILPEITRGQLMFVSFAQGWCTKATDEYYRMRVATDPHSPPQFRVLGPLINLPEFSETFKCPVGTPMNPVDRCEVW